MGKFDSAKGKAAMHHTFQYKGYGTIGYNNLMMGGSLVHTVGPHYPWVVVVF